MKSQLQHSNILVADDHPVNLVLMQFMLEQEGAVVYTAADGNEVLSLIEENPQVDLMLLDVQMPGRDGKECATYFKSKPSYKHIRLVAISAESGELEKMQCFKAGFDAYLEKPLDIQKLNSAIHALNEGIAKVENQVPFVYMKPLLLEYLGMVTMNDKEAAFEILHETASSAPLLIADTGSALESGDFQQAATVLHKLKSLVAIMEFEPLLEYIKIAEMKLKANLNAEVLQLYRQHRWAHLLNQNLSEASAIIESW